MRILIGPTVALLTLLAFSTPSRGNDLICKNHYILRCEIPLAFEWQPVPSPLIRRGEGLTATTLADGRVLVTGAGADAEIFDPVTASWSLTGSMNVTRVHHRAVRLNDGRVLVVGGDRQPNSYGDIATAEVFDPIAGSWTRTPPLKVARAVWTRDLTATLLHDGTVLVTGGNTERSWEGIGSAEIYDPVQSTWELTGGLARGRVGHAATLLPDGRVLVTGGVTDWDMWFQVGSAELYEPASRTWRELPGPSTANHSATLLGDGRVVVAGGQSNVPALGGPPGATWPQGTIAGTWIFDPAAERWSEARPLFTPRHDHMAIRVPNGDVLAAGGRRSEIVYFYREPAVVDVEQLDVRTGDWRQVEMVGSPPEYGEAATLADGSVLAVGGMSAALLKYIPAKKLPPRFSR